MSIFNPYAFTPFGQPAAPTVSALRAIGAPASAAQLCAAQSVFRTFCAQTQLSAAPNQTAIGRLPDGTQYKIAVVGAMATMTVWPTSAEEDTRPMGIGIMLTYLDGRLVPGHTSSDKRRAQPYILTPEAHPGTRRSTGKWRVHKVDSYRGGKAVWSNEAGTLFITGVDGINEDRALFANRSIAHNFVTNVRAYWCGEFMRGTPLYTNGGELIGSFRDMIDTVPFFMQVDGKDGKERWLMQITPVFLPLSPGRLQLYGGKYRGSGHTSAIGDLVDELELPDGLSMEWRTLSVSSDGRSAKITARYAERDTYAKISLTITEEKLSITSIEESGGIMPGSTKTTTTGDYQNGSSLTVKTQPREVFTGGHGYDIRGDVAEYEVIHHDYGYGPGKVSLSEWTTTAEGQPWTTFVYLIRYGDLTVTKTQDATWSEKTLLQSVKYKGREEAHSWGEEFGVNSSRSVGHNWVVELDAAEPGYFYLEHHWDRKEHNKTTGRRGNTYLTNVLFADHLTELFIISGSGRKWTYTDSEHIVSDTGPPGDLVEESVVGQQTTGQYRMMEVKYKGATVLLVETPVAAAKDLNKVQYAASSATDPLTGAVCVNILELAATANATSPPLRSWVVLADDTGVKMLHDVLDIPHGTDIRIAGDYALLSVV